MSFANFAIEAGINSADTKPAGSDPKPAPVSGPPSVPSTSPGNTPAAPSPVTPEDDGEDLSFGLDDVETDDGEGGAPAQDDDVEPIQPIGPPPTATPAEVAQWRADHGVPSKPSEYAPPTLEGLTWDSEILSPIMQVAHKHNVAQAALAEALETYAATAQRKQAEHLADLKRSDKERMAEVKTKLTPGELSAVSAASSTMSPDLRRAMKQARLPNGELLLHNPEFLALIANLNKRGNGNTTPITRAQDDAARMDEIKQVLRRDAQEYFARGLDKEYAALLARQEGR